MITNWRHHQSDFHMGTPGMRWDPDYCEWVWPERLPAFLSWFDPQPFLDVGHLLGYGTPDPEGQRRYALAHGG